MIGVTRMVGMTCMTRINRMTSITGITRITGMTMLTGVTSVLLIRRYAGVLTGVNGMNVMKRMSRRTGVR